MLKFLILTTLFCIALTARVDLSNNGNLFRIALWYNNSVSWTLNGKSFAHLQALTTSCASDGSTPVSIGNGGWTCGPVDTLKLLNASMVAGQIVKRSSNGSYVGAADSDVLGQLSCTSGQVAKWNGTAWACASDSDSSANFPSCTTGQVLTWGGSAWGCLASTSVPDSNVLTSLSCTAGAVAKKSGTSWVCGSDNDTVPTCSNGQTVKYNATTSTWVCAADSDTLATIACNSTYPFPKYRNGAWSCVATYAITIAKKKNVEATGSGKVAVLNSVNVFNTFSATSSGTIFKTFWGYENQNTPSSAAVVVPIAATLYSVTVRMTNFSSNDFTTKSLTFTITKNGATVATNYISVPAGAFSNVNTFLISGVSFTAGDTASATITCTSPGLATTRSTLGVTFFLNV
eukprot:TRINITY_DN49_c0_g1_i1.p1 TRINITY_DN49_c0_g1~~TRINITY_DN49_c0_g1_i1.p1  ORF type:complete len:446 (-),score=154.59 TRINITY_DN49_c0_g1_i1:52-1257(-)